MAVAIGLGKESDSANSQGSFHNGLSESDEWRVVWENMTMPTLLSRHLAKRVYDYTLIEDGIPDGSTDFDYAHAAIGNVESSAYFM